jgi:shikimate dehydrogenase
MKKYLVIGNPIDHSLSPKLHNYWINKNDIDAIYEKKKLSEKELEKLILKIKQKEISGINVTVPFKKKIIPYLDQLTLEAKNTQSVNTVYLDNDKTVGHNTDIEGFEFSIKDIEFDPSNKKIFILGAGGVVPSLIYALNKMKASKITLSNRTKDNAENLKNLFNNLIVVDWGVVTDFDMIINATSIGLKKEDNFGLNFSDSDRNKFFYDVIYNPLETDFLRKGKKLGNKTTNGKMMFIYQASAAFKIWHGIQPEINKDVIKLVSND